MEDNTNNHEESKVDQLKEDVQDAKDIANIGTKAAAGNYAGAAKDTAKKVASEMKSPKKLAKKIARKMLRMLIPIIAIILIAALFFGAIFEIARIIKEKLVEIKDKILGWIGKWTTGDGIVVDDDDVDELLDELSAQGIDLADLGFMADEEDVENDDDYKSIDDDETLSEKEKEEKKAKKKARKYIKRFMEASLVTQTVWTNKNGIKGIPGGIKLERRDAKTGSLSYLTYEEDINKLTGYDKYSLDSDGKVVFLGKDGSTQTIDTSAYEQYTLPIMYFIDLCLATQNPRYVKAIADGIVNNAKGGMYNFGSGESIISTGNYDQDGFTQRVEFNGIQYTEYKQNSSRWAGASYWGDTIGNSGCGPTSVAVVLSGFSQTVSVTPVDVAGGMSYTGSSTIQARLNDYGIRNSVYTSNYESKLRSYLGSGKPVICSFNSTTLSDGSHFTSGSHISVALGINGDQVYISNVYNSTNMRTGWVPISDVVSALTYLVGIDSAPDNRASGSTGVTSLDGFLFLGDSRIEGIESELEALGNNITAFGVGSSAPSNWIDFSRTGTSSVPRGNGGSVKSPPAISSDVNGICIMLGTNNPYQTSDMKTVLNNLHTLYQDAPVYVCSVYHVTSAYNGSLSADGLNSQIDSFNSEMKAFCEQNDWATYINITNGLYDASGYLKTDYAQDTSGVHINSAIGKQVLVENIKSGILSGGTSTDTASIATLNTNSWMTISIMDSCVVTTKTGVCWYEELDDTGNLKRTEYTINTETEDYTTTYCLKEVNHLLFSLNQLYEITENQGEPIENKWQSGNQGGDIFTTITTYGFTAPIQQDPVIKTGEDDFFVRVSKKKFSIPYNGLKISAYQDFIDGGGMLFALMDNNLDNELLVQMMKYVLYKMTNIDFGVTELDFTTFNINSFSGLDSLYGDTIEEQVWFALRDAGYSEYAVAGVMGNIYAESGFDATLIEAGNGIGFGLVQWSFGRRTKLEAYASSKGVPPSDIQTQIEFLITELSGSGPAQGYAEYGFMNYHGYTADDWENAQSATVAATAFCWSFERPGKPRLEVRTSKAEEYYNAFKGKEKPSSSENGSMTTDTTTGAKGYVHPCPGASYISSYPGSHSGYDFAATQGTPVYAVADGTVMAYQNYVTRTGKLGSYGNWIKLITKEGNVVIYAHLNEFVGFTPRIPSSNSAGYGSSASSVSISTNTLGSRAVKQGECIGYVGTTGNSSGPHLHFEIQGIGNTASAYRQYIPSPN